MNKKIYIFIFIVITLFVALSIKLINIYEDEIPSSFFSYDGFEIDGNTIIKYSGKGNIVIPEKVNGVTINKIGDNAFNGLNIDSVIFPDTITEIGDYAFANNNLTRLELPDSVISIGEGSFIHNEINDLKMNEKTVCEPGCFNDNQLPQDAAFFYKVNADGKIDYSEIVSYGGKVRSSVTIPSSKNDVSLKEIGPKSFWEDDLVAVIIPDSVEKIDNEAFKNNYLVELYLSNNIKSIDEDAFSSNDYLTEIIIDNRADNLLNYPWGAQKTNIFWLQK